VSNKSTTQQPNLNSNEKGVELSSESTQSQPLSLRCPKCGVNSIAYSRLQKFDPLKRRFIAKRPHRCMQCYHRFWVSEKMFANPDRVLTLAIVCVLLVLLMFKVFDVFSAPEQVIRVSVVAPELNQSIAEDGSSPQSDASARVASSINMPQDQAQKNALASARAESNRELMQAREESLTPDQLSRRLLLAKQQAEAATQLSQARVEQLKKVLLSADNEIESLVKIEVRYTLERWRNAWAKGDLTAYLLSYSSDFKPADDTTFEQWQSIRKSRVTPKKNIMLELNSFDLVLLEQRSLAVIEFDQRYQAGSFVDNSRKRLRLVKEQGSWKIIAEVELP
jgi:Flp pilus assembly protein TadG